MSRPSVTIVIPTHNRVDWLRGAIDSVLEQDYEDLELLVIDDGSRDETPELVSAYGDLHGAGRFRYLIQENSGQAAAINRGWRLARGAILGYLSDDDRLLPGAVARLASELEASPEASVAYPSYHMIDEDDRVIDTIRPIPYSPREAVRLHDTIIGPGALIRRRAVESAEPWDPELRWMGDLILWLRITRHGPALRVPESLACWRRHTGSLTAEVGLDHAREHLRVAELGAELTGGSQLTGADMAEALRNACILGCFFGGDVASSPGDRFAAIDLQGPEISAFGAGIPVDQMPDERADDAARLWRALALLTSELTTARGPQPSELGGLEEAQRILREVGLLGSGSDPSQPASAPVVRLAMMEAALHCSRDAGIERNRFLLLDRNRGGVTDEELDELLALAMGGPRDRLQTAIEHRREELERLRSP